MAIDSWNSHMGVILDQFYGIWGLSGWEIYQIWLLKMVEILDKISKNCTLKATLKIVLYDSFASQMAIFGYR